MVILMLNPNSSLKPVKAALFMQLIFAVLFSYSNHASANGYASKFETTTAISCQSGFHASPEEPRLETTLTIDLTRKGDNPAFLEFYIIPADEAVDLMGHQTKLAKDLQVNDLILMENGASGRVITTKTSLYSPQLTKENSKGQGYRRILGKSKRWTHEILQLTTANDVINTTPEHPFYVNKEWIEAKDLVPGDRIANVDGSNTTLLETHFITPENGGDYVYNLKVEGAQNFYVGNSGLLAHNCINEPCRNCGTKRTLLALSLLSASPVDSLTNSAFFHSQKLSGGFFRLVKPEDATSAFDWPPDRSFSKIIQDGDTIGKVFDTKKGKVNMGGVARVDGDRLTINDITIFPQGGGKYKLGNFEILRHRKELAESASEMGFNHLTVNGVRTTGANPGKIVSFDLDLNRLN